MTTPADWTGEERRAGAHIPAHITDLIRETVATAVAAETAQLAAQFKLIVDGQARIERLLQAHIADESKTFGEIEGQLSAVTDAAIERHKERTKQLEDHIHDTQEIFRPLFARLDHVEGAFLRHESGMIDAVGHHNDHHQRKVSAQSFADIKTGVTKEIAKYGAVALLAWVAMLVWQGLKGPTI